MSKRLKALIVSELESEFRGLDRCVIVGLTGVPATAADRIRAELESKNVRLKIVKNTMASVAFKQLGYEGLRQFLTGPSAIVTGGADIVDLAKTAGALAKGGAHAVVKGGFGEGKVLSPEDIDALSKVPGRQELLSMLAGAIQAAMGNFAGVLGAVQRDFLYALGALRDKSQAAA